ncbi:hypothetical protein ILYODFUR_023423 [Ilyodon furcidens]|uniref:Uncharacterized protein n=1 Tax=Ilyodon furcidens TaxID=33524 RepID=A0ABV0UXV5_9TELE
MVMQLLQNPKLSTALSLRKEAAELVWASDHNAFWNPHFRGFLGASTGIRTQGNPELSGGTIYSFWSGNSLGSPRISWTVSTSTIWYWINKLLILVNGQQ